jgi:quercetin dioxygenase-like cupin family protein
LYESALIIFVISGLEFCIKALHLLRRLRTVLSVGINYTGYFACIRLNVANERKVIMADRSITKVSSAHSPKGKMGQRYLASGVKVSMRLWEEEQPDELKPASRRDYETIGYVIKGRAELHIEGQMVLLEPGDSWVVPEGSEHAYKILEAFTAVEATCPPAAVHARDET